MATFTLVHGSTQNGRCWDAVVDLLEKRGHRVVAPELPRSAPEWNLTDYAAEIARHIDLQRVDNVVVAHSFSGVFLPLVAAKVPVQLLVFLAAVIPEPGKSVRDQYRESSDMFAPEWIREGTRWSDPTQHEQLAREFLFHDCDEENLRRALGTLRIMDTQKVAGESCPLTKYPAVATASIVCTMDRTLSPDWGKRTTRDVLGQDAIEMAAGHSPYSCNAPGLARLLHDIAEQKLATF